MTEPKAAPQRRNPSRTAKEMRDQAAKLEAADTVAAEWVKLCQNEPLMVELLLPEPMRRALGELARVTAS